MKQLIILLLALYLISIYKLNAMTNNCNENKKIEQSNDISDTSTYQYGVFKINKKQYIYNLGFNVQAYLEYKQWNYYECEEFRHSYLIIIEALKEENRLSSDSFGTISDKAGKISNVDEDDYWYDNNGNRITGLEYRNLSPRKQKKYRAFYANVAVAKYFNIIAQATIEELNKRGETTTYEKTTKVHYPERKNNYDIKKYGNSDITIYRTSVTYDPQYNMCVTLHIANNTIKKIVAIKVGIYYSSKEQQSVDREEVSENITLNQGETEEIFLFGSPKPTYAFMMLGKISVYFSDGTMQELY